MLRKISLGTVGLWVGGVLTIIGFVAYATENATLNLVGFFYGVPILLGGFALKAAELKPVPLSQPTPPDVLQQRQQTATSIQNQIRQDVMRYRYGQDAHSIAPWKVWVSHLAMRNDLTSIVYEKL